MKTVQDLQIEIYNLNQQLDAARKVSTPEAVQDYVFQTLTGTTTLADQFGDHELLFLIHNMGTSCNYCTMWADVLASCAKYLQTRGNVVLVSPNSPDVQDKVKTSRNWPYTMLSDTERNFTTDMGYYASEGEYKGFLPGISVFKKLPSGDIVRTGHSQLGPMDDFNPVWHIFSMAAGACADWEPDPQLYEN